MFFDAFQQLCAHKGVSPTKAAVEMGLSRTLPTKWKNTGATPDPKTLQVVANYFGLTFSELLMMYNEQTGDWSFMNIKALASEQEDTIKIRQMLRDRPEMRLLFETAQNAPASAIMDATATIMRFKEEAGIQ